MRLLVYTDYVYRREGDAVYAERAFALFLAELRGYVDRLVIAGRLDPEAGESHYRLPPDVEFVPLPHYGSLVHARQSVPEFAKRPHLQIQIRLDHVRPDKFERFAGGADGYGLDVVQVVPHNREDFASHRLDVVEVEGVEYAETLSEDPVLRV